MYTMKDWERDGSLRISVGQLVADDVVTQLRDCVPPACCKNGLFQVGEPKDQDLEHPAWALYDTFTRAGDCWVYRGACLRGKTEARKGYIESLYNI